MSKGEINIRARLDRSELRRGIEGAKRDVAELGEKVRTEGDAITEKLRQIGRVAGLAFGINEAKNFVRQMTEVRGQFQQLEIAFSTILGSATKADALMQELVASAAKTPFDLTGIAESAKQLLAYGVSAEKVNETLLMLGDIASGLSIPLTDLAYLYGTTIVQGRMFTQDLRQFTGRGIPLIQELAKQFGVAESAVGDLVTEGKVGLQEFQRAIEGVHADKFAGLMEKQSASLTGKLANLSDAVDIMMNNLGRASEGVIGRAIDLASELVENYEDVGRALVEVAGAIGVYKASMLVLTQVSKGYTLMQIAEIKWLRIKEALQKRIAMTNPYGLVALGVTALVAGIYKLATATTDAEKAQKALNESLAKGQGMIEGERIKVETLFATLRNAKEGTTEWNNARNTILSQYGKYLEGLGEEIRTLRDVEGAYKAVKAAALESARARAMETATSEAQERYSGAMNTAFEETDKVVERAEQALLKAGKTARERAEMTEKLRSELYAMIRGDSKKLALEGETRNLWQNLKLGGAFANAYYNARQARAFYEKEVRLIGERFGSGSSERSETPAKPAEAKPTKTLREEERKKIEQRLKAIREYKDKVKEAEATAELELRASRVSLMQEGLDKELETAQLRYDQEIHQVRQMATKWVTEYRDAHGLKSATIQDLTEAQRRVLADFNASALERYAEEEARIYAGVLAKYQGYEEKRSEIQRKYQRERDALQKAGGSERHLEELKRSEQEALEAVDEQFATREATYRAWLRRIEKLTLEGLKETLKTAEEALREAEASGKATPQALATARAEVATLKERIREQEARQADEAGGDKGAEDWQKLYETLVRVQGQFDKVADSVGGAVGETLAFASACMTTTLTAINGITQLANWSTRATEMAAKGATQAMIAVERASVILTIIGAVLQLASAVKSLVTGNDKLEEDASRFRGEVDSLNRSLATTKQVAEETGKALQIFGGDGYSQAVTDLKQAGEAQARFEGVMKRRVAYYEWMQDALDPLAKSILGYDFDLTPLETMAQKYGAILGNMQVQTKEASRFLFFTWGEESKRIRDLVPQLFNPDQSINMDALDKFIGSSTYEKLTDSAKQSLAELQQAHKEYQQSLEGLRSYLKDVFGSLGNDLMANIVDAFRKGEDASKSFAESVEKTLERMVQNMIFSSIFSGLFKEAEETLTELMTKGGSEADYIDYFGKLMTQIEERSQLVEKRLKNAQEAGDRSGLNLFRERDKEGEKDGERRTPQQKGIATASQDSVDELNGRATAIQGHTYTISENSKLLVTNTNAILTHVAGIHRNTDELHRLRAIEASLSRVDRSLTEATTRGIKAK